MKIEQLIILIRGRAVDKRLLVLVNMLLVISTVINVIHKLNIIQGPNAHIAIAILSLLVLFGYSGVLNSIFLKRKFHRGRVIYIVLAVLCQLTILLLSFLSFYKVMTYFDAIAIIHAIMGLIVMINFTCAVLVVREQQMQIDNDQIKSENAKLKRKIEALQILTKRAPYIELQTTNEEGKVIKTPLLLTYENYEDSQEEDSLETSERSGEEATDQKKRKIGNQVDENNICSQPQSIQMQEFHGKANNQQEFQN